MSFLGPRVIVIALTMATAWWGCQSGSSGPSGEPPGSDVAPGRPSASAPPPPSRPSGTDASAVADPDVDVTQETMTFAGATRTYLLARPRGAAGGALPLVLSFHGNPGAAERMANGLPFDSASKRAAVIAYPQALDGNWDLYTPTERNKDMEWVRALVGEIATKASIDEARVFGFGYSGGGFFITQVACRFGGLFRAISVNAGGGPDEAQMGYAKRANGCYVCPGGPIPTLVTHGDADTAVEPGSGEFTANCFAATNGCEMTRSPSSPAPCQEHDACPAEQPVKFCLLPGLGHEPWAGAIDEAWSFFTAL